ncbi:MAG: methionine adenosyltransferase [Rikenellaceae bacterium]
MNYLFTSESVSEGHPDKVADQISDAILDEFLKQDPSSKVACETLCTTGLVVVSGEVKSSAYVDVQSTVRKVIDRIGYNDAKLGFEASSCGVLSAIHEQSSDINQGVEREQKEEQGAGDQGMMFGYACRETASYMPAALMLSHLLVRKLASIRRKGEAMTYLRPDAKSQVTIEYNEKGEALRVHTIVISTQHSEDVTVEQIKADVENILIPELKKSLSKREDQLCDLIQDDYILHVNPTGKFCIGGPHGDTGLTGRKIIVDTYGGKAGHGGGAFSGKDSSKVDRSAAYATRHIAKNMVAAGICDEVVVQVAYAIGVAQPVSLFVDTRGTSKLSISDGELAAKVLGLVDMRPAKIVERFGLTAPIYSPTAAYGHFGQDSYEQDGFTFFGWERLDLAELFRGALL